RARPQTRGSFRGRLADERRGRDLAELGLAGLLDRAGVLGTPALLEPRDHLVLAGGVGGAYTALVAPLVLLRQRLPGTLLLAPAALDERLPHRAGGRVRRAGAVAGLLDRVGASGELGGVLLARSELAGDLLAGLPLGVVAQPADAFQVEDEGPHCCSGNR